MICLYPTQGKDLDDIIGHFQHHTGTDKLIHFLYRGWEKKNYVWTYMYVCKSGPI